MARAVTSVGDRITALASAGTLYLSSTQNVILTRVGCGSIAVDLADWHPEDADVVAGEDAVAVLEVADDVGAVDRSGRAAARRPRRPAAAPGRRPADGSGHCRGHGRLPGGGSVAPHRARARSTGVGVGSGMDCVGRRPRAVPAAVRRAAAPAAARGRGSSRRAGQRQAGRTAPLIAGVAGDGVGQGQMRFTALAGARIGHRQRRRARLADLRVGALRRQQHVGIQAEVGERGVDERLQELAGQQVGDVALKNGPDDTDSPSDIT